LIMTSPNGRAEEAGDRRVIGGTSCYGKLVAPP
jgi:hypothetical protein